MYSRLIRWLLLPTLIKVRKAQYWDHYHEMLETDKLSLNELRNIQFTRLKQILEHAHKNVVFYQERLQKSGIITQDFKCLSDLTQFPITTTEDVRLNFPDRIIAGNLDKTNMVYTTTSGTTMKTESVFDNHKANLNWAAVLRAHKQSGGYNLGDKWMEIPPPICTTTCGEEKITSYGKPARSQFFNLTRKLNLKELNRHIIEHAYAKAQKIYRRMSLPSLWKAGPP